jgi:predicted nucleic acid-binding protein
LPDPWEADGVTARPIVIDASVAMAIIRDEADGPDGARALAAWTRSGRRLVVPSHFWLEIVNALVRRHRWPSAAVIEAIHELDLQDLETVGADRESLLLALDAADRFGLSAYDAAYLSLAVTVDGDLLTFDQTLAEAAGTRSLTIRGGRVSETPAVYEHDVTWPNYKHASAYLSKLRAEALADR